MATLRSAELPRCTPSTVAALAALAALGALIFTLWLPFGWKMTGLYEEWFILRDADAGGPLGMLWNPPYPSTRYRPLLLASFLLGYLLTPNSFVGLNVVEALLMFGKGVAMYFLVRRLVPENPAVAFASAALLVVYPADDALLTLRTVNVHAGVFLLLLALNLLIVAYEHFHWTTLLAMLFAQVITSETYDAGLPLMICGPVLLVWLRRGIDRRVITVAGLWEAVSAYFLIHLIWTLRDPASYPAQLVAGSGLGSDVFQTLRSWLFSVTRAYVRVFGTGWYHAWPGLDWRDPYLHLSAGLVVFVIVPAVLLHARRPLETQRTLDTRRYLVLASLGIIAVLPGFALYLPTVWRNTNWRVFSYSSIGGALAVSIACFLFARLFGKWHRQVFVASVSLLVGIATFHALAQHHGYFEDSQRQQQILAGIISQAPHLEPGTTVLLIDHTPTAAFRAWSMCMVVTECVEAGLRYIYGDHTLRVMYCAPGYRPRGQFSEECRFEADLVTVSYTSPRTKMEMRTSAPYATLVVFEDSIHGMTVAKDLSVYRSQDGITGYEAGRRIDTNRPVPPRAHTVFTRWPFEMTDPRSTWRSSTTPPSGAAR